MSNLQDIAFNNLKFLNDKDDFLANRYKIENKRFVQGDDDDTVYSLNDLEYPVFFTFHQLMNHVHSSYGQKFHGKTKKELLDMFQVALDTLNEYYIETDNTNKQFECLLDDIDDKVLFVIQYYKYGCCHRFPTSMKDYFMKGCKLMIDTSRLIIKDYVDDLKDPGSYDADVSDDDSQTEKGSSDEEALSDGEVKEITKSVEEEEDTKDKEA